MSCDHDWHGSDIHWNMWGTDCITVDFEFACWKCGATASADHTVKMSNMNLTIEQEE